MKIHSLLFLTLTLAFLLKAPWVQAADSQKTVDIIAPAAAQVIRIDKQPGDTVYSGDQLVTLKEDDGTIIELRAGVAGKVVSISATSYQRVTKNSILGTIAPAAIVADIPHVEAEKSLPSLTRLAVNLFKTTGAYGVLEAQRDKDWTVGIGRVLMIVVGLVLLYLGIFKGFEPLLLIPIGYRRHPLQHSACRHCRAGRYPRLCLPCGDYHRRLSVGDLYGSRGIDRLRADDRQSPYHPARRRRAVRHFHHPARRPDADQADTGHPLLAARCRLHRHHRRGRRPDRHLSLQPLSPRLLGSIAIAAYSYMALVPIIQPPIMKWLTTKEERQIRMVQLRHVSKLEKIFLPVTVLAICAILLPSAAPLIGMFMLGNLAKECGVIDRMSDTIKNALMYTVTIFLGLGVGSKLSADKFLNIETLGILVLGMIAFGIGTASGVLLAKLMNKVIKEPDQPADRRRRGLGGADVGPGGQQGGARGQPPKPPADARHGTERFRCHRVGRSRRGVARFALITVSSAACRGSIPAFTLRLAGSQPVEFAGVMVSSSLFPKEKSTSQLLPFPQIPLTFFTEN